MTSLVLAVSLILTPAPVSAPKEPQWTPTPPPSSWVSASNADTISMVEYSSFPTTVTVQFSIATTTPPTTTVPPPALPLREPIEVGMDRLTELGATPYQLRVFGCLAWFESKNDPYAVSRTNDKGLWQINNYYHSWRWRGRDIFDPIVNAEVAWDIYRESGFRAWTTHNLCGV